MPHEHLRQKEGAAQLMPSKVRKAFDSRSEVSVSKGNGCSSQVVPRAVVHCVMQANYSSFEVKQSFKNVTLNWNA